MYYVYFMSYSYFIPNPMNTGALLNITLDSNAKLAQRHTEGYYTLNSIDNENPNWIQVQGSCAIWYDKELKNWKIGPKEYLGTSTNSLYSTKNTKRPDDATSWKYWSNNDGKWMSTSNIFGSLGMY